jgi:hypothetical protein
MNQYPGMNPFSGFGQAAIGVKAIYFQSGFDGEVRVVRTKAIAQPELSFVAECEVVMSNHEAHPVGQIVSFHQKMSVRPAKAAILEFAVAAIGLDPRKPEDVAKMQAQHPQAPQGVCVCDAEIMNALQNETQNNFIGRVIHLVTHEKQLKTGPTQKNPRGVVTVHTWTPSTGKIGTPARAQQVAPLPTAALQPPAWGPQPQAPALQQSPQASWGQPPTYGSPPVQQQQPPQALTGPPWLPR